MDDVLPFLDNVLRGRKVPRSRKEEVAEHYKKFNGISPINQQNRDLIKALDKELTSHAMQLPIYWGNRNWHPMLDDTVREMSQAGIHKALAFVTSAFSSYSGCRQYRENIRDALLKLENSNLKIHKLRAFFNHPGFIESNRSQLEKAFSQIPEERRATSRLLFTAHSIPIHMATSSAYVQQLKEACRLTAEAFPHAKWDLVYQSRSGSPAQPWLEPDLCDVLRELKEKGVQDVVVSPIGFISDHMEVLFDLDTEAREVCDEIGIQMVRAKTVGTHPRFVSMIRELIEERLYAKTERAALGHLKAWHDVCPEKCCLPS